MSHGASHLKGIGQANLYRLSAPCSYCEERGRTPRGAGTGGDSASTNNAPNNGYRLKYRLNVSAPRGASESEESKRRPVPMSGHNPAPHAGPPKGTLLVAGRPLYHRASSRPPRSYAYGLVSYAVSRLSGLVRPFRAGSGTPMGGGPWRGVVSPRTGVRPSGCPPSRSRASPRGERPSRSALPPPLRGQVRSVLS